MVKNVNIQQRSLNIRFDEERRSWPVTMHNTEMSESFSGQTFKKYSSGKQV